MTGKTPQHTVRPEASWRSRGLLCFVVFALIALLVYRWGLVAAKPVKPATTHTATAAVRLQGDCRAVADPQKVQRQITSKNNIYRAVHRLATAADAFAGDDARAKLDAQAKLNGAVNTVGRNLRVSVDANTSPDEVAVSIAYADLSSRYAARLVNAMAEAYADDCRARWKGTTYQAYAKSREASERAKRELLQARKRLDEFSQQRFDSQRAAKPVDAFDPDRRPTDADTAHSADSRPPVSAAPAQVDNPKWVELNGRLATLQRRLEDLLIDRTPLHPEVRDTELRIAALNEQLSQTPKRIDGRSSQPPAPPKQAPAVQRSQEPRPRQPPDVAPDVAPDQAAIEPAELDRTFQTLKQQVDRATDNYMQAVQIERQAWQQHQRQPQIELEPAAPEKPSVPTDSPRPALIFEALAAALAVAAGVGMISAGAAIQIPLTTVAQVRTILPVPVVGTVPGTRSATQLQAARRRRSLKRWTLVLGGLIVILVCAGALLQAWGG